MRSKPQFSYFFRSRRLKTISDPTRCEPAVAQLVGGPKNVAEFERRFEAG